MSFNPPGGFFWHVNLLLNRLFSFHVFMSSGSNFLSQYKPPHPSPSAADSTAAVYAKLCTDSCQEIDTYAVSSSSL